MSFCKSVSLVVVAMLLVVFAAKTDAAGDDCVFIHHSCGANWLSNSLNTALVNKSYIDERNDIYYGTSMSPDAGRPASLGGAPGDNTNMNHWILWFNDYLERVKTFGCADGENKIIMFKSCYPISDIGSDGTEPGSPFSGTQSIVNYKSVYRHPSGSGSTYTNGGYTYYPLEDIFAANPGTLFIIVTAPPLCYGCTDDDNALRARTFNNWLKNNWLGDYNGNHPTYKNVRVFDWFDVLANATDHATYPNRLKEEYGGSGGDSHPNSTANAASTVIFASGSENVLDDWWQEFQDAALPVNLVSFQAAQGENGVRLTWTTMSEDRNLGWNIYRGLTDNFSQAVKINTRLLPGAGTCMQQRDYHFQDKVELKAGQTCRYWLQSIDLDGLAETHAPITVTAASTSTVTAIPQTCALYPNYPNPFNEGTCIKYDIPASGHVRLDIIDARGALQATLINRQQLAGTYTLNWNARGLSSGVYFCILSASGVKTMQKLLYIR